MEKINQLESQIWCWAIIYYRLCDSIVTDKRYDATSKQLKNLIDQYPDEFKASRHYNVFKDFEWVSGYDLPLYDPSMTKKAEFVLMVSKYGLDGYKNLFKKEN